MLPLMPPTRRDGAMQVGYVAAFLVSPLASAVTGTCFYVDQVMVSLSIALPYKNLWRCHKGSNRLLPFFNHLFSDGVVDAISHKITLI